jgi:hypothetical protein
MYAFENASTLHKMNEALKTKVIYCLGTKSMESLTSRISTKKKNGSSAAFFSVFFSCARRSAFVKNIAFPPGPLPLPASPAAAPDFFADGRFGFADFFVGASDSSPDWSSELANLDDCEREEARDDERSCSESESGTIKSSSSSSEALDFFFDAVHAQINMGLNMQLLTFGRQLAELAQAR